MGGKKGKVPEPEPEPEQEQEQEQEPEPGAGRETRPRPRQGQHGRNIMKTKGIFSSRTRRQGGHNRGRGKGLRRGRGELMGTGATTHETAQNARRPLQLLKCFRLRGCLPRNHNENGEPQRVRERGQRRRIAGVESSLATNYLTPTFIHCKKNVLLKH